MGTAGAFSIDQLMELAGLACAQALATVYGKEKYPRVLVCCGPGNQGGDGLVAARHLGMFGYKPTIWIPKLGSKDIYKRLHTQCTNMHIPTLPPAAASEPGYSESSTDPDPKLAETTLATALAASDVVLDAIFGFSFRPPVRAPFDAALPLIARAGLPIVSVDIPSGWDVERGDHAALDADQAEGADADEAEAEGPGGRGGGRPVLYPDVLVSLTAPKEGVRQFAGRHFLGGRFVPRSLEEKYELNLPRYPGFSQIVELPQRDAESPQKL